MRYPGGKGKTFQHVINLMPPHRVYIETHLGGGAVMRNKRPASKNIGIDLDDRAIAAWASHDCYPVEVLCGRAEDFLARYEFKGDELVYVDPPYHPDTRRQAKVYRCDYTAEDHEQLLSLLTKLPCMVIISGYANDLYSDVLSGWRTRTFQAKTHTDTRVETLWFNFDAPQVLHDTRFLGSTFRERQSTRRRIERLQEKVAGMDPVERAAFARWLSETYPVHGGRSAA